MFKIILIEDDIQVLRQLNKIISGIRDDFKVSASFTHPMDAIEYLNSNKIDAIITDIQLPEMSGIELCEYCSTHFPNVKCAILSAYDYFEYAQKAIDLEVVHYVLKPITISKLEVLLNKLSERISRDDKSEGFVSSPVHLSRQQAILNLLSNFYGNYNDFFEEMRKNEVDLNYDTCICAAISIGLIGLVDLLKEKPTHSKDELYQIITQIVARNNSSLYSVLFNYSSDIVTIFVFSKKQTSLIDFKEEVSEFIETITVDIKNILETTSEIKSIDFFNNIDEFSKSQRQNNTCEEQAKNIISHIYDNNFDTAIQCAEAIKMIFDENQSKLVYFHVLHHLTDSLSVDENSSNISAEKLLTLIVTEINKIKQENLTGHSKNDIIDTACRFINNNFANDITLNDVAKHVFLNPIYFSSYFKKMTGEKYSDYLANVKLQQACHLLKDTDIKIPDVAQMSEFKETNYFYKIFKNSTGLTPLEYRKKHKGDN